MSSGGAIYFFLFVFEAIPVLRNLFKNLNRIKTKCDDEIVFYTLQSFLIRCRGKNNVHKNGVLDCSSLKWDKQFWKPKKIVLFCFVSTSKYSSNEMRKTGELRSSFSPRKR